jgi:hypothetical protein
VTITLANLFLYSVLFMAAGFLISIPYIPCIWLCLERDSTGNRLWPLTVVIGVFVVPFTAIHSGLGLVIAAHLLAATWVLLAWRHLVYEPVQFSLRALLLVTLILGVALTVATPLLKTWPSYFLVRLCLSLAIIAPAPALLAWASLSLKWRLMVVPMYFLATGALLQWWSGDSQPDWPAAWALLMMQCGYSLSVMRFTRCFLRDEMIIWTRPCKPLGAPQSRRPTG